MTALALLSTLLLGSAATPPLAATDPALAALIEESLARRPELRQASDLVRAERERVPQIGRAHV